MSPEERAVVVHQVSAHEAIAHRLWRAEPPLNCSDHFIRYVVARLREAERDARAKAFEEASQRCMALFNQWWTERPTACEGATLLAQELSAMAEGERIQ